MGSARSTRKGSRAPNPLGEEVSLNRRRAKNEVRGPQGGRGCCMLKISCVEGRKQRWLVVEGRLVAPWSDELKAACERAGAGLDGRELAIDLKNVTTISQEGENLLLELMQQGLKCRGCGVFTNEILKQVARRLRRNGAHE